MASTSSKNLMLSRSNAGQPTEFTPQQLSHGAALEEDSLVVKVEVPGVNPAEIGVHCDASVLYVECERGTMTLPIDAGLDTNEITADVKWGMLELRIPRRASRAVKINIHEGVEKAPAKSPAKTEVKSVES